MPYIKSVHIQGFQSHVDSTFTLTPGLNVITGPSDAGKTAIIRALRWLAFNEPQGEGFIYTVRDDSGNIAKQCEQATVTVEFDNSIIVSKTRRKGKTIYTHSEYPDVWEKAELPQEIKDSLGLLKQTYGDNFDTCLNFAYQLDPPFMLSETGSTGAKVLGKLAGTEVVDKSIGVVVKETHHTRELIRTAEKRIGQYDVELLEYLGLDEKIETLTVLLKQQDAVNTKQTRHTTLVDTGKRYSTYGVRIGECLTVCEQLNDVPNLVFTLETVDKLQARLQQLKTLAKCFWDSVNLRTSLHKTVRHLENVPKLFIDVDRIKNNADHIANLQYAVERLKRTKKDEERLNGILCQVKQIEGVAAKITAVNEKLKRYYDLRHSNTQCADSNIYARMKAAEDMQADKCLQLADDELKAAWEAAGGICPLCNQSLEGVELCH